MRIARIFGLHIGISLCLGQWRHSTTPHLVMEVADYPLGYGVFEYYNISPTCAPSLKFGEVGVFYFWRKLGGRVKLHKNSLR